MLLQTDRNGSKDLFDLQYEKLPFYCMSCGIMGHSELECEVPAARNALGKLPYDVKLRALEDKKKKVQSFATAATESFGSDSSRHSGFSRRTAKKDNHQSQSSTASGRARVDEEEVLSPLKETGEKKAGKDGFESGQGAS